MHRQAVRLRQIAGGEDERGSLTIFESSAGRPHRGSGSGGSRVMVKSPAWLPKTVDGSRRGGPVLVRTGENSLLDLDRRWRIDPAPLRRMLAAESRRRSSLLADLRAARTPCARRADGIERTLSELRASHASRLADASHTYAAHSVVNDHIITHGARRGSISSLGCRPVTVWGSMRASAAAASPRSSTSGAFAAFMPRGTGLGQRTPPPANRAAKTPPDGFTRRQAGR